jgi:hypothetical protein
LFDLTIDYINSFHISHSRPYVIVGEQLELCRVICVSVSSLKGVDCDAALAARERRAQLLVADVA